MSDQHVISVGSQVLLHYVSACYQVLSICHHHDNERTSCSSIPYHCHALNKLGYHLNYPYAVAFAPIRLFECGICNLCIEQGLAQINALLNYIWTGHKIGDCDVHYAR